MSVHADPPPAIVTEPHGTNYATSNQLGKGGFAICFKAERLDGNKPTGHVVALKIVKTKMEPAKLAQKFITELQIHSKLSHPNIVGFHRAFSFGESTYVVLELCSSGSLADLLKRRKCLTMPEIRRFMIQVCGAVKYLHTRNIVHRDLKTGNLFLDEHMNVKVGDFGLAALLVSGKDMDAKRRTTMCGTPNYLAPEILEKGKGHSEKVDLWAIGIISYTLAVGKAPFHAASKEEIYKKLKAGEYSWPELSSITNDISADLRDLVSTLLVPEELRPSPDMIVAHPFFKIAFVPPKMSRTQLTKTPVWPVQLPTPEALQRGYSDTWWSLCKDTGVGEYQPGKCFQLNAGKRIRSVVKDIEKEVAAGRQPVIPIPSDTVYTPFPYSSSWVAPGPGALDGISEEKDNASESRQLREISHNEVSSAPTSRRLATSEVEVVQKKRTDAEMMPPPRRRGGLTVRKTRAEPAEAIPQPENVQLEPAETPKAPIVPVPTSLTNAEEGKGPSDCERPAGSRGTVDATLARRPRAMRRQLSVPEPKPRIEESQPVTTGSLRRWPTRSYQTRAKQAVPEVVEVLSDEDAGKAHQPLVLPSIPTMAAKVPVPTTRVAMPSAVAPGSDPATILDRLSCFRDNLASALQKKHRQPSRRSQREPVRALPFVSRWVDYSRKHGVGYVLDDGTVGFIASSEPLRQIPVTHVAVRNGERWLRRVGKKFENLDKVPFHILEDQEAGIGRLKSLGTSEQQRERQRMLRVLWVKFGRYMSQSLNGTEESDGVLDKQQLQDDLQFVRFYQRMGNVGIWGFADGCLQLHFPDHTKFVFSADGLHVSATLVSVEGASIMAANNELPARLLRDRQVLEQPLEAMLHACQPGSEGTGFADVVRANMFEQKLEFLLRVLDQWLEGGGLGCAGHAEEKLQWNGLWVKDHAKKVDWVTVGRRGGDEVKA